jgi:hypothetical protein
MEDLLNLFNKGDYESYFEKYKVQLKIVDNYLIIIGKRGKTIFSTEIIQKYINTIIDLSTHEIKVYTGGEFNYNYNIEFINKNFNEYNIYPILDGTRISLWYSERAEKYVISTRKLINANDIIWKKTSTYMDILEDILTHNKLNKDIFNKDFSYNLIIKHPLCHPFNQTNERPIKSIHLINIYDTKNKKLLNAEEFGRANHIPCQSIIEDKNIKSIEDILIKNKDSINNYFSTYNHHYGFILRTKNYMRTKGFSNIILYSSIYNIIKNVFYDKKQLRYYHLNDDNIYSRITIIYITYDKDKMEVFIKLFPQYIDLIEKIKSVINKIIKRLIKYYTSSIEDRKGIQMGLISGYIIKYIDNDHIELSTNKVLLDTLLREIFKSEKVLSFITEQITKVLT